MLFALGGYGYDTVFQGKEGMVAPEADIATGQHIGTALAHQNRPYLSLVSGRDFDTQVFGV